VKEMTIRSILIAMTCVIGLSAFGLGAAKADTVLYDNAGFVQGLQTFETSFNLSGPGILTVTLSNIAWPEKLAALSFLLTTSTGPVGTPLSNDGTEQFNVSGGPVYALWYGQAAQGSPFNLGVYGLKIAFQSYTAPPPVPLPTSILLLLSGLGLLAWQRRQPDSALNGGMQAA
jgi:hypothetical protein